MTLIKSISGIRGIVGAGLDPIEIAKFTAAYAAFLRSGTEKPKLTVVIGRDARVSGEMVNRLVTGTLMASGIDVIDLGLATTPTVEMAVTSNGADGGVILTASHNPAQWNALKLLNARGEFLSAADGEKLLAIVQDSRYRFMPYDQLGNYSAAEDALQQHIRRILELPLVDVEGIRKRNFRVAFDAVNSVGGIALPALLAALGVSQVVAVNDKPDGLFAHNPEPLPEHLGEICERVVKERADVGFVVDPDVDRLAIVNENGTFFGEEYTLVAVADYILADEPGNTVSNLSSTKALKDITEKYGGQYFASAVGEVNVVEKMKNVSAVIGGEGNGGVIYPALHYGRDALVGIALFLSHLAKSGLKCSELRQSYPDYFISKNKIELTSGTSLEVILDSLRIKYKDFPVNDSDGVRVDFPGGWVHLRPSNTEPIIRIYAEARTREEAEKLAGEVMREISS